MFRLVIAGVVVQYSCAPALLRNLETNLGLAQICGFNPLPRQQQSKTVVQKSSQGPVTFETLDDPKRITLPDEWALSRFVTSMLERLTQRDDLKERFEQLREQLRMVVLDFGCYLAYDEKATQSHSTGWVNHKSGDSSNADATWGKHESKGVGQKGRAWNKVKERFEFRLHAIVDSMKELPVDYRVTTASDGEVVVLSQMLKEMDETHPQILEHTEQFSAECGLDVKALYGALFDDDQTEPVIDMRELWRQEKDEGNDDPQKPILRMLNGGKRIDNIVYAENGMLMCRCLHTDAEREMCFMDYEKDRGDLKVLLSY